jgi:uncharacterized protein
MKILTVSDKVDDLLYSPAIKHLCRDVELVLACGDLPYYYLEYLATMVGASLFYVIGNHPLTVRNIDGPPEGWAYPGGCVNLDGRVLYHKGLLIAGLEGSMRYNNNYFQYTEREMARKVYGLAPWLLLNKLRFGRYLDILITHAPPWGIHDRSDLCHQGFRAFRTVMERFRPRYLVHGHIHVYSPYEVTESIYQDTRVINTYGYRILEIQ